VRVLPPDPPTDVYMTNGRGFIALAALIFGRWNPIGAAALLFGFAQAVTIQAPQDSIPQEFLQMVPYILTMVVLGKPYRKK
jgi:general nucleoside transport system permease protein